MNPIGSLLGNAFPFIVLHLRSLVAPPVHPHHHLMHNILLRPTRNLPKDTTHCTVHELMMMVSISFEMDFAVKF